MSASQSSKRRPGPGAQRPTSLGPSAARTVSQRQRRGNSSLSGAIVNLSSIAGLVASAGERAGHYAASKAAVIALTRQMAVEWSTHGIHANAAPTGVIDTPMLRLTDDPETAAAYLDARVPLHRLGTAEEVAAVICFLASGDAAYVTGCALPVDGGIMAV